MSHSKTSFTLKTLNNLTPAESHDLITTFGLDFNTRVLHQRLHECINSRNIEFKSKLTNAIERWMLEIEEITEKLIKHENETENPTGEDA